MDGDGGPVVEFQARVSADGAVRTARFVAVSGETVPWERLLMRVAEALPEFEPVAWHNDYPPPIGESPPLVE